MSEKLIASKVTEYLNSLVPPREPELQKMESFLNLKDETLFKKVKKRKDLIKLPLLALWGLNEKYQHDFDQR